MAWRPEWDDQRSSGGFSFGGASGSSSWSTTKILLVAMVVIFLITTVMESLGSHALLRFLSLHQDNWYFVYPGFTYVFAHDTLGIGHLLMNGLLIWFIGSNVEGILGRRRYLTLFFGSGLVGAVAFIVAQFIWSDSFGSVIGASGAALGLLFFLAWEHPHQRIIFLIFPITMRTLAYIVLALDLFPILKALGNPADGVAHSCHLGGALFGYLYWRLRPDPFQWTSGAKQHFQQKAVERRERDSAAADAEMDRILAKINDEGMPSLTKAERKFLQERSRSLREDRGR